MIVTKLMLFSNPFTSEFLLPTVHRLGALLGFGLVVILIRGYDRLRPRREDVLFKRWTTWAVIAPCYVLAVLGGQVTTALMITAISFQALREYAYLVQLPHAYRLVLLTFGLLPAPVALFGLDAFYFLAPLLLILATLQPLTFGDVRQGIRHLAFAAFGWAYIAWFLAHSVLIHNWAKNGPGILVAVGTAVALSDVAAFVGGKLFGKYKLAPQVSPNKTWEGAVGNFLGAYLGVALMSFALPDNTSSLQIATLPAVIALGAIWGDLVESVIKREFGAKDAGAWLPGFGGLLDRIDSFIMVIPLVYFFLTLAKP
jgi:phosphatidate cytidylyltransferase